MLILDVQGQISRGGLVGRLLPLYFFNRPCRGAAAWPQAKLRGGYSVVRFHG